MKTTNQLLNMCKDVNNARRSDNVNIYCVLDYVRRFVVVCKCFKIVIIFLNMYFVNN